MDAQPPHADDTSGAPIGTQAPSDPGLPGTFHSTTERREHIGEETVSLPEVEFVPGQHKNLPAPEDDSLSRAPFGDDVHAPSVHIDSAGPYSSPVDGNPAPATGLQEPASSFVEPIPPSFQPFGSAQAPYPGFRGVQQGQATGEQSDSTHSSSSIRHSSRNHQPSVIVVGVSGNAGPDRGTLIGILRCVLPNVREVVYQDDFRIVGQDDAFGTVNDVKEHVPGLDYKFDIQKLRRALKALRRDSGPAVQLIDREHRPSSASDYGLPSGVDEEELKTRLWSEIQGIQSASIVIVEGPSLYNLKAIRKLIDVRICLLEDKDKRLPWAPMTGTLFLSDYGIRGRRKRYEEDLLDTVVWRDSWYNDGVEGRGGQYAQGIIETIASWAIGLVADTLRDKREEENRDRNDGRHQICDCGDGLIGRMRRWVVERL
jgi:uridine kinase